MSHVGDSQCVTRHTNSGYPKGVRVSMTQPTRESFTLEFALPAVHLSDMCVDMTEYSCRDVFGVEVMILGSPGSGASAAVIRACIIVALVGNSNACERSCV